MILKSSYQWRDWQIDAWEMASGQKPSQDDVLVQHMQDRLRIAAIDGATPAREHEPLKGVDTAVFGASIVRTALKSEFDLEKAALSANEFLHDPSLPYGSWQAQATMVACDIQDGNMHILRAGDCNAWIFHQGEWQELFYPDCITPQKRAECEKWVKSLVKNPISPVERARIEEEMIGHKDAWVSTALGRFAEPVLEEKYFDFIPEKIILASDGVRLNLDRVLHLDEWIRNIRTWEKENRSHGKIHDDVSLIVMGKSKS